MEAGERKGKVSSATHRIGIARASLGGTCSLAREAVDQTYLVVLFIGVDSMGFMLSVCTGFTQFGMELLSERIQLILTEHIGRQAYAEYLCEHQH